MNDDLKKYQDILVNLTLENKTICLDKIDQKNFFDLYNLNVFNQDVYSNLTDFIFSEKINILKIIDNPLNWENNEIEKIKLSAEKEKEKNIQEFEERDNIKDFKEFNNFLDEFYRDNINKKLDMLNDRYKFMSNVILDLVTLYGKNESKSLYIGYPFVEGYIDNKNYVKMPIFLIPIKLFSKDSSWFIEKDLNSKIRINKYLTLILDKICKVKSVDVKQQFRFGDEFNKEVVYYVLDLIKTYNITLKFEDGFIDKKIEKFSSKLNSCINKKAYLKVKNMMILGNFKVIGSEYEDYECLDGLDLSNNLIYKFLNNIQEEQNDQLLEESLSGKLHIKDSLDFSQKNILKYCSHNRISVINSPIDTGKSTTIFNFILDKISRNKKVLLVSRNSYERDKVYGKFSNLSPIVMKFGDRKKGFYEKFLESFNFIMSFKNDDKVFEKFNKIIDDIENKYSLIKDASEIYNNVENFGLSLQQMYEFTIGIDKENLDNMEFKKFTLNNPVSGCTFSEIVSAVNQIKTENLIKTFIEYKEYLNKYKVVSSIREDFDINKIPEFISKIEQLKNKNDSVSLHIDKNECSLKICELLKSFDFTRDEILSRTKEFYNKYEENESNENKSSDSWFKGLSFLKGRKNLKKDSEVDVNEEAITEIYNYYDSTCEFLEDLKFLEEILKKDNFNFIKEKVLDFEDITEFITNLKEMLESIDKFLINSCKIKNCDSILSEILNYIYENSINIDMMEEILDKVLKFSILINIMRRQHKYGDILMKYKFVDEYISDIKNLLKDRKNIINDFVLNKVINYAHSFISYDHEEQFVQDIVHKKGSSIKEYIEEFDNLFLKIFPCVISNYDEISSKLPMIDGMFDYVIIDNAHEYSVADVLPFMFRGKNLVLFGDKNRINFKNKEYKIIYSDNKCNCDNLFKFAIDNYEVKNLRYLYSKNSEVLNDLSNMLFDNNMIKFPNLLRFSDNRNPFNVFKINSQIIDGVNENEAEFVVELLYDILKTKDINESVGIITLTKKHANLISSILENRIKLEKEFNFLNYKEQKKYSNNLYEGIYIKTLEEIIYEDRRDIIIFSLGSGFNDQGCFEFHVDGLDGYIGLNQLNILSKISKKDFKIVSSFDIENFDIDNYENENIKLLKKYLFYAKMISNGKIQESMEEINNFKFEEYKFLGKDIIYDVQQKLIKNGLIVDRNVGNLTYKFDLGIYDIDLKKYILLLDFDGKLINRFSNDIERNIESLIYFDKFECNVLKLWSRDLWSDLDVQINNIMDFYKKIKIKIESNDDTSNDGDKCNLSRASLKIIKDVDKTCKELIYKYITINNRK